MSADPNLLEQVRALAELHGVNLPPERAAALAARYSEYRAALDLLRAEGFGQSEPALDFDPLGPSASPSS